MVIYAWTLCLSEFDLRSFLSTESEQLIWKSQGLPSDDLSMENALVILKVDFLWSPLFLPVAIINLRSISRTDFFDRVPQLSCLCVCALVGINQHQIESNYWVIDHYFCPPNRHRLSEITVLYSECWLSIPDWSIIPCYRVVVHSSPAAQTRGYQPTGKVKLMANMFTVTKQQVSIPESELLKYLSSLVCRNIAFLWKWLECFELFVPVTLLNLKLSPSHLNIFTSVC